MFPLRALAILTTLGLVCAVALVCSAEPKRSSTKRSAPRALRTWSDTTDAYKIRARFLEIKDGKVRLERSDGTVMSVPLEKLHERDRRYLETQPPVAAEAAPAAATGTGDWPWFRGLAHDGKSTDTGLLKEWPAGGPPLAWKVDDLGEGFSSATVVGDTVYITGGVSGKLMLFAFGKDGSPKWQVEHGPDWTENYPGARGSPTVDGNRLYLLSGRGLLCCFDTQNGRRIWSRDAKEFGGAPGGWGYAESPLILDKLVIFKPGGKNCIVALDKATGQNVWASRGVDSGPEYSSCLPVTLDRQTQIVTGTRDGIVSVDARSGALLWGNRFCAGNVANCPTPAFSDGYVFWANGYGKGGICLKLGSGGQASEAWTTRDMVCHHGGYVILDGYIYGNHENGWSCLELKTGKKMWSDRGEVGKGSLCWADGMFYLFGEKGGKGALAACTPQGIEIRGQVQVDGEGPSWAHPVVVGGRLYLRYHAHLYCFDVTAK